MPELNTDLDDTIGGGIKPGRVPELPLAAVGL